MTCIVGVVDKKDNSVWIGGDSLGSNRYTKTVYATPKVIEIPRTEGQLIAGFTGTFRHIDSIRYYEDLISWEDINKGLDINHKYMVTSLVPKLVSKFQEDLVSESAEERGGTFLIGGMGKLFLVQSDYSVLESANGFDAVGIGAVAARGSLVTTEGMDIDTVDRIVLALEAAERCVVGVERPFTIRNTKTQEVITIE